MVYINHEYRLIVIENPKSGSTTLVDTLGQSLKLKIPRKTKLAVIHMTSKEAKELYKKYWDTYLKVTTYRDPLKRFISSSFMPAAIANYDISHIEHNTPLDTVKLEQFYKNRIDNYCFCRRQTDYTDDMDFLIRLDNFQEDYNLLCDRLGIEKVNVPVRNKNTRDPLVDTDTMKEVYCRIYQ